MSYTQNYDVLESTASYTTIWRETNWKKVNRYVNKLRHRIFRAESEGNSRKVRDLQRLLIRSKAALKLAIRRVTQTNKGKRTPGVDGFTAMNDAKRGKLFVKLNNRDIKKHKPKPVKRIYIPKKNGKKRSLGIPTIIDRVYQELLRLALEPQWEARFEPTSYGFRPARRTHDALERIFFNTKSGKWSQVFEGDFKACFDTISHEFILKKLDGFPYVDVIEKILKAGYNDEGNFFPTEQGTPQGGLLSPLLANIALTGLEDYLNISYKKSFRKDGYEIITTHGNYRSVRYADDFLIFAQTKEEIEEVYNILEPYLEERGLILAEDKTDTTTIYEGFDFLGFNIRREDGNKCIIKPSKDSLKEARAIINEVFGHMKGHNVGELISVLNPVIDGIAEYWKPLCSTDAFHAIDHHIWTRTWIFLNHLHSGKSKEWIVSKYFPKPEKNAKHNDRWILTDPKSGEQLHKMRQVNIERHTMVKGNYSPLDRSKFEYFKKRFNSNKNYFR